MPMVFYGLSYQLFYTFVSDNDSCILGLNCMKKLVTSSAIINASLCAIDLQWIYTYDARCTKIFAKILEHVFNGICVNFL